MTMIVNVSKGTRCIGGATLAPSEMEDVNMSSSELDKHLFVRCGDIEVSGRQVSVQAPVQDKKSAADIVKEIADMTNEDDLAELLEDSRKTVREAAETRLAELTGPEGGEEGEEGQSEEGAGEGTESE